MYAREKRKHNFGLRPKVGGASEIKMKVFLLSFCISLGLHYLCKKMGRI